MEIDRPRIEDPRAYKAHLKQQAGLLKAHLANFLGDYPTGFEFLLPALGLTIEDPALGYSLYNIRNDVLLKSFVKAVINERLMSREGIISLDYVVATIHDLAREVYVAPGLWSMYDRRQIVFRDFLARRDFPVPSSRDMDLLAEQANWHPTDGPFTEPRAVPKRILELKPLRAGPREKLEILDIAADALAHVTPDEEGEQLRRAVSQRVLEVLRLSGPNKA